MNKKYCFLHQKAEENMKCKVKANYLEVNGQIGKGSTTVVVFVVQVGSNPKKEAKKSLEAWWQADLHSSEKSI